MIAAIVLGLIPVSGAYGHGLDLDTVQSVDAGGKDLTITVEISPESGDRQITVTTTEDSGRRGAENITLLIRLFHQGQMILQEQFFAHDGVLRINAVTADSVEMSGEQDPQSGVWRSGAGPLTIAGPTLGSGGLYRFEIEVVTVDDPARILDDRSVYSADVSILETASHAQSDLGGGDVQFRTKSYFDTLSGFEYDAQAGRVTVEMPFDWSEKTISHIPVVHVEVHIPDEFAEFLHPGYTGRVNGIDLFRASVTIDDYTEEDERIVHFVLLGDHVKSLKTQQRQAGQEIPDVMTFTLDASDETRFPMTAYTRDEQFRVDISWDPVEVQSEEPTNFVFTIRDGATGEPLRQSTYGFVILQAGSEIYRTGGNAVVGGSFETYTFSEDQTGQTTIRFEDIRGTGAVTEFGVVVVPEFGITAIILIAGTASAVLSGLAARGLLILK